MSLKSFKPITNSQRNRIGINYRKELDDVRPEKGLITNVKKLFGRGKGKVMTRHKGGRQKRFYREIDFRRDKFDVPGMVMSIEYDPNRTSFIALINYEDGEKRYILAPHELKTGDKVLSGKNVEVSVGNSMTLDALPLGSIIHNIELEPGKGGQLVRSAGSSAVLMNKEGKYAQVRMPSGEIRLILLECRATLGALSNPDNKNIKLGKAGAKRRRGIRPSVRGTAMHPDAHPHGGGEGKSGTGMPPKTPWGKRAMGLKTRKKKASDRLIIKRRK